MSVRMHVACHVSVRFATWHLLWCNKGAFRSICDGQRPTFPHYALSIVHVDQLLVDFPNAALSLASPRRVFGSFNINCTEPCIAIGFIGA